MNSVTGTQPSPSTVLDDGWSEEATFTLIDAWGKLFQKVNRNYLRQYHWKEIAKAVNDHHGYSRKSRRTYVQCKNRVEALKKKYAIEKARVSENGFYHNDDDDEFPYFDKLDSVIGDTLPTKKVLPPSEPTVNVPAWALAPVGLRSGAQSTQKRPVMAEEGSVEEESRFRRNLSAFAAEAAAAAEAEIDNSDSDDSYFDNSDGSELNNENRKRKRGRKDVEFGYREVAGRSDREFGSREVANVTEKFGEVHERVESSKQQRNAKKFSEIHERVELSKQRRNVDLEKRNMQFQKDCQRLLQLQKTNHSREMERTTSMNDRNEQISNAFVQIRLDPSFQEIRKRAQMSSAHNTTPHRLSRGGYELLQEKMMKEKLKQKQESLGGSVAAPPSPPARHEQWKRARQKPSGDYTSEDTRIIAEKIDSLVEKTSQGTFVPQGQKDILTEAIGRPEHSGRVRGVGRDAQVPIPTDEVETVEQALNHFIQWPKRFVQIVSDKDVDGSEKDDRDIMELCMGKQELSITILRLWLTYLNRLSINVGKNDLYGFIDPCFIQSQHDPTNAETYIQNKLSDDKKECYLAPYHNNHHWQLLIICPRANNVVFLCSLERKPDKNIIHTVDSALDGYHKLQGVQKKKPTWIYPICQRQPESYESGYYIMIHMLKIVSAGIIDSWMQIFGNPEPFEEDELVNVRQRCLLNGTDLVITDK
ncbi:hypothetical protein P8452_57856 [Trifolium repens]|nr:hypothetical protein P8452_57856 [Trifolium repens]